VDKNLAKVNESIWLNQRKLLVRAMFQFRINGIKRRIMVG